MKTSVAGVGPNMNGAVPWRRASSSHRSASSGFTTCAAPNCCASSRRRGAGVDRHHVADAPVGQRGDGQEPDRAAARRRPPGPPVPRRPGSPPACRRRPARSARRRAGPCRSGTGNSRRPLAASRTRRSGVRPPSSAPLPSRPSSSSAGWTMTRSPGATPSTSLPGPLDHAGHLVTQRHRPAGDAAHVHEGDVGAADPAGRHPHDGVARARRRGRDVVEANVVGAVDPDLLHRPGPALDWSHTPLPHWLRSMPCRRSRRRSDRAASPGASGCASPAAPKAPLQLPDRGGEGGGFRTPSDRCLGPTLATGYGAPQIAMPARRVRPAEGPARRMEPIPRRGRSAMRGVPSALNWALYVGFRENPKRAHSWNSADCDIDRSELAHGENGSSRGAGEPQWI